MKAVVVSRCASKCSDYTGQPRLCSRDLWNLRAFAIAVGGFARLSYSIQQRLVQMEQLVDSTSCFVAWPGNEGVEWMHVVKLWPGGFPTKDMWLNLCQDLLRERDGHARVRALWKAVRKLRDDACLEFDERINTWRLLSNADQRSEVRSQAVLVQWRDWRLSNWKRLLERDVGLRGGQIVEVPGFPNEQLTEQEQEHM